MAVSYAVRTLTPQQEKRQLLKDLGIWKHMTNTEKTTIKTTDNEIRLEQWVRFFIKKYL